MAGQKILKSVLDRVIALGALIVLSPVIGLLALAVRQRMGSPVLHRQERPGLDGKPFVLVKFRTMTDERDSEGRLLSDEARLTAFGSMLRRSSLDELPELWNVLRGEMSLVGPRPLLMEYLELYTAEQARRHEVKPGITGLAQVNGRNALDWEERLALDVSYVDNWNLWLDFKILARTVASVVTGAGVSAPGHVTVERFKGSRLGEDSTP